MIHQLRRVQRELASRPKLIAGLLLAGLMVLVYFRWMNFEIFTYGDWSYKFPATLRESAMPFSWVGDTGFGAFNEFIWRMPLDALFGLFSLVGLGLNVSDKFLIFWPLIITTIIAPYLLVKEIMARRSAALAATLFYATNTYFLAINSQGHQLLPLAFNILTIVLTLFIRAMRSGSTRRFMIAALLLFVAGFIDFRVCYIGVFLLAAYSLAFWPRRKPKAFRKIIFKNVARFFAVTLGLQLYWLLAFGISMRAASSEVLARSLFGNSYWDLSSVITLHHPFWNGTTTTWFISNGVPLFFWIIPLLALWGWLLKPRSKYLVFFAVTAIVGILLGKQVSEPLRGLYPFLFDHLPGFSAFREATKFYYLTLLGYTVLLGYLVMRLYDARPKQKLRRYGKYVVLGVFAFLCFLNAWPYISGSMGRLLAARKMPADYAAFQQQVDSQGKDTYYRTLWVPASSRWSYYSLEHPRVNATSLLSTKLDNPGDKRDVPTQKDILGLLHSDTFQHYLSITSVKYVVVPIRDIDNQNDFFGFYGDSRQPYIDALDASPFLKKVKGRYKDLAVYENKDYQPYAAVSSTLYNLPGPADFAGSYPFLSSLSTTGQYAFEDNNQLSKTSLKDVFTGLAATEYQKPALTIDASAPKDFFFNANKNFYSYQIVRGKLRIYKSQGAASSAPGSIQLGRSKSAVVASVPIEENKTYFLKYKDGLAPLDLHEPERDFGSLEGEVSVYVSSSMNLVPNGSFEQGPWEKDVRDCDPYDAKPKIGMTENTQDQADGSKSLNLWALRHTACTRSAAFPVTAGTYLVSFKYKSLYSDQISYRIIMDGKPADAAVMRPSVNTGGNWLTHAELVTIPPGISNAQIELRGLPPGSFSPLARFTHFDDVKFAPLEVVIATAAEASKPTFQKVQTAVLGANTTVAVDNHPLGGNLIKNPSIEDGLWQKTAGDCNNYDDEPRISMQQTTIASDGKHALELRARRHIACTGPEAVEVQEGKTYLLEFAYQSPSSKTARFNVSFDDFSQTSSSEKLEATSSWQTHRQIIKVPLGATQLSLRVDAVSDETGRTEVINRYDNFSLVEVPDVLGQLYAVDQPSAGKAPASVATKQASSSKKEFDVRGAKDPFYLSMAESYHADWKLEGVATDQHFQAYGFTNGWRVDPATFCAAHRTSCTKHNDGTYDLRLVAYFTPQRWLAFGSALSSLAMVAVAVILIRNYQPVLHSSRMARRKAIEERRKKIVQ